MCSRGREVERRPREIVIRRNCNFSLTRAVQPLARRAKSELMMRTRLNALCSCSHFPERCELPAGGQPRGDSGGGATWREGDSAVLL